MGDDGVTDAGPSGSILGGNWLETSQSNDRVSRTADWYSVYVAADMRCACK